MRQSKRRVGSDWAGPLLLLLLLLLLLGLLFGLGLLCLRLLFGLRLLLAVGLLFGLGLVRVLQTTRVGLLGRARGRSRSAAGKGDKQACRSQHCQDLFHRLTILSRCQTGSQPTPRPPRPRGSSIRMRRRSQYSPKNNFQLH